MLFQVFPQAYPDILPTGKNILPKYGGRFCDDPLFEEINVNNREEDSRRDNKEQNRQAQGLLFFDFSL